MGFTFGLLVVQLVLWAGVDNPWHLAAAMALLFPAQSIAIACVHYQHHRNVFKAAALNRAYEVVLFLQTGLPPYLLTLHHNFGHHARYLEPETDTLRWRRDGASVGWAAYLADNFVNVLPRTLAVGARVPRVYRRFKAMLPVSAVPLALLLHARPASALLVFVAPMALMVLNVVRIGYHQHAGLDVGSHFTASRNDGGPLYNWLSFNSGYHTAHHVKPSLHWSELADFHRRIETRIPPSLRG